MLAFPKEMLEQESSYDRIRVVITTKDNETITLTQDDIWNGSLIRTTSTGYDNEFTLGAAVTGKLSLIMNNIYGEYDKYDFHDSTMVAFLSGDYERNDGVVVTCNEVCLGYYIIDDYQYDGSTISISGLDYMSKLDKEFDPEDYTFPITLIDLVTECCQNCGVTFTGTFTNSDFIVQEAPKSGTLTCHDVISYAAQIAACYARVDTQGQLYFGWYDIDIEGMGLTGYDGGEFDTSGYIGYSSSGSYYYKYSSGDELDGGSYERRYIDYTDSNGVAQQRYADGDDADGGTFTDRGAYHYFNNLFSLNTSTDEETITGVKVTVTGTYIETTTDEDGYESSEERERTEVMTCPLTDYEGFVVEIADNPLISLGQTQNVADRIGGIINGMRFRPLTATVTENPSVEAGDVAVVTDISGASFPTFISNVTYKNNGPTTIGCDSQNSNESKRRRYTVAARTGRYVEETLERVRTGREIAMEYMYNLIRTSPGLYVYTEIDENDAVTYYLVNKMPDLTGETTSEILADSNIRWRFTAESISISTNYGRSYPISISASGSAILGKIYAIGVNADYITTGDLVIGGDSAGTGDVNGSILLRDENNNIIVRINKSGIQFLGKAKDYLTQITQNEVDAAYINALDVTAYTFSSPTISGKDLVIGPSSTSYLLSYMTNGNLRWDNSQLAIGGSKFTISPNGGLYIDGFSVKATADYYYEDRYLYHNCRFSVYGAMSFRSYDRVILTNMVPANFITGGTPYYTGYGINLLYIPKKLVMDGSRHRPAGDSYVIAKNIGYIGYPRNVSDRRLKKDIEPIEASISERVIWRSDPSIFKMRSGDEKIRFGFIAQTIDKEFSADEYSVVNRKRVRPKAEVDPADDKTFTFNMDYMMLIAPLAKAIQDNDKKIERLKAKVVELKDLLQRMKGA